MIGIPKKTKRPSKKSLVTKLDTLVRKICRLRDKRCCSCGKAVTESSQVSHYIGRRHHALRWDLRNCHMSCAGCNIIHNYNPAPYTLFMNSKYGDPLLQEFQEILKTHSRFSTADLHNILDSLKEVLDSL